ncbi:hypothetical protein B0T21DRAFT_284264 [Apiosordaria backusii]|uniref:FAD-binding PCMH-type domain-containing protein n=1 Tax=Apiosordaria backusii TaxID=314023 RepID=A0AA40BRH5_9PEZI|nr:hypothetical protein B0T21DRAFT_284264 [Apiosordaria backusii]
MNPSINHPGPGSDPGIKPDSAQAPAPATAPILLRNTTPESDFHSAIFSRVFNHRRPSFSSSSPYYPTRLPFGYCKPLTVSDILACVAVAKAENKRISIRSGGHSWACWSVRHDAILLDMIDFEGGVESIRWEPERGEGVVSCASAVTSAQLNEFLEKGKRVFPGGHCPDVGLGGFLLQGGMGWNCKNWGWACEYVVGVDVVTAEGEVLHCDKTQNEDLFFAARGAGPGFPAIVTRFYLRTLPLLPMWQSLYFFDIANFKDVLEWLIKLSPTASPTLEIVLVSSFIPQSSPKPTLTAVFTSFSPSHPSALAALQPIHDSLPCPPSSNPDHPSRFCQPTSLPKEYAAQLAGNAAPGFRTRSDNAYLSNNLSPSQVATALEPAFSTLPTKQSTALWFAMNPTSRRTLPENMALSMQSDHYFSVYAVWKEDVDDEKCDAWVKGVFDKLEEDEEEGTLLVGSYLGDADFQFRQAGWRFWGEEERGRLEGVRGRWDPRGRVCGFLVGDEAVDGGVKRLDIGGTA